MAIHFQRIIWALLALALIYLATIVFLLTKELRGHEALTGHPEIQREFDIIQARYECLQGYPKQMPSELILCDQQAHDAHPPPR